MKEIRIRRVFGNSQKKKKTFFTKRVLIVDINIFIQRKRVFVNLEKGIVFPKKGVFGKKS